MCEAQTGLITPRPCCLAAPLVSFHLSTAPLVLCVSPVLFLSVSSPLLSFLSFSSSCPPHLLFPLPSYLHALLLLLDSFITSHFFDFCCSSSSPPSSFLLLSGSFLFWFPSYIILLLLLLHLDFTGKLHLFASSESEKQKVGRKRGDFSALLLFSILSASVFFFAVLSLFYCTLSFLLIFLTPSVSLSSSLFFLSSLLLPSVLLFSHYLFCFSSSSLSPVFLFFSWLCPSFVLPPLLCFISLFLLISSIFYLPPPFILISLPLVLHASLLQPPGGRTIYTDTHTDTHESDSQPSNGPI